ncbi:hypothetical protein PVK06_034047 [Gossypium arboreum]|uniref:CCHC-type domain-containing protein n=1 Tax=Gossypium arboreum TaxID=29729 RepID=A0ABR0NF87_GOSAR|nr:hypothetical protein PVK06_034047 [Gossypium arboreum]
MNGMKQRVEYEALLTICFTCGKYGHTKELCVSLQSKLAPEKDQIKVTPTEVGKGERSTAYGPWMVVERKTQCNARNNNLSKKDNRDKGKSGSRFDTWTNLEGLVDLENEQNKGEDEKLVDF